MICPKCDKTYDDKINICPECGTKLIGKNEYYWYKKAIYFFEEMHDEEAIESYDKLIELNPNNPEYWDKKERNS